MREIDHLVDADIEGRTVKFVFKEQDEMAWIGLIWLKIGTCFRLLKC
jgi:hypothetical protein